MNEIKKMFCPSCGGPVSFQPGREDTFCSHCGAQLYFKDDKLEVKLKHEEVKMEYADRSEERKIEDERQKRELKFVTWICIGCVIFFFACMGLMMLSYMISH